MLERETAQIDHWPGAEGTTGLPMPLSADGGICVAMAIGAAPM